MKTECTFVLRDGFRFDLPAEWAKVYMRTASRYRETGMYATNDAADRAAFEDVRQRMWDERGGDGKDRSA